MPSVQDMPPTNIEFLQALFGEPDWKSVPVFELNGDPETWNGGWATVPAVSPRWPSNAYVNNYYCVSLFAEATGRRKAEFRRLRMIVMDDVGPKLDPALVTALLGEPTYKIETSPGNAQWGWRLAVPLEGPGAVSRFTHWQRMVLHVLLGPGARDPGHANVTRLARLPYAVNSKGSVIKVHGMPFPCRLTHWDAGAGLADFAEAEALVGQHVQQFVPQDKTTDESPQNEGGSEGSTGFDDVHTSPAPYVLDELEAKDDILAAFRDLGLVLSAHPRETGLGKRTWMVRCPWEHEHTARGDTGAAYAVGGAFKCHHGHCENRHIGELNARLSEMLGEESGGLDSLAARSLGVVDPASVAIPEALEAVRRAQAEAEARAKATGKGTKARDVVENRLSEFWGGWGYLRSDDRMVERATGDTVSRVSFDAEWTPVLGPRGLNVLPVVGAGKTARSMVPSAWYLSDTRKRLILAGETWEPGMGQLVRDMDGDVPRVLLNRWKVLPRPLELAPDNWVDETAVAPWRDLVAHVLDGNAGRVDLVLDWVAPDNWVDETAGRVDLVLDWLALVLGAPGVKPGWHVLLMGEQGIGKELMVSPLTTFLGPDRSTTVSAEEVGSSFTGWICNRLVLMPELRQTARGAPTGHDRYGMLKTLLDNGKPYLPVNPKYGKPFRARNVAAAWATSNEDKPLDLSKDDRRFWVHASAAKPWTVDAYARLVRWMETAAWVGGPTGTERVCEFLLRRWDTMPASRRAVLTGRAPMTQSKLDVIALGADPWEGFLRDTWGTLNELVTALEISRRMLHAQRAGEDGIPPHLRLPSMEAISGMLRKMGAVQVAGGQPVRIPGGERARVWARTVTEKYLQMGGTDIADAIAEMRKKAQHNNLSDDFGE